MSIQKISVSSCKDFDNLFRLNVNYEALTKRGNHSRQNQILEFYKNSTPTTEINYCYIKALTYTLQEFANASIHLDVGNTYIKVSLTKWLKLWNDKRDWKNSKGDPVQFADEWKELSTLIHKNRLNIVCY